MGEAFEAACNVLNEAGQSSVVYEAVAKCIIEIAKSGERDPNQLRDRALAACSHKRLIPLIVKKCFGPVFWITRLSSSRYDSGLEATGHGYLCSGDYRVVLETLKGWAVLRSGIHVQ